MILHHTLEPNQIVTVLFTVPGLDEISGWNLSLRDKGGNILAEVSSGFDGTPDTLFQAPSLMQELTILW